MIDKVVDNGKFDVKGMRVGENGVCYCVSLYIFFIVIYLLIGCLFCLFICFFLDFGELVCYLCYLFKFLIIECVEVFCCVRVSY